MIIIVSIICKQHIQLRIKKGLVGVFVCEEVLVKISAI